VKQAGSFRTRAHSSGAAYEGAGERIVLPWDGSGAHRAVKVLESVECHRSLTIERLPA